MKRIVKILIIMVLMLGICNSIYAKSINELKLSIDIPKEYYDLKEGIETNDSKMTVYEATQSITREDLQKYINYNKIYYYGVTTNYSKKIIVSKVENSLAKKIFHLHEATEEQIEETTNKLREEAEEQGIKVEKIEIYEKNNIKWIKSIFKSSSHTIFQYYTIVNGYGINISLDNVFASASVDELKDIIDTASITEFQEKGPDITTYALIGTTAALVIMVAVLVVKVFSKKEK